MILDNLMLAFAEIGNVKTLLLMIIGVGAGLLAGSIPGFTIARIGHGGRHVVAVHLRAARDVAARRNSRLFLRGRRDDL